MNDPIALSQIRQIALAVGDVAKAKQFQHNVLGLRLLLDAGPNLSFLAAADVRIMLTTPQGASAVGGNSILYFKTASLDMVYKTVLERGAQAERAPQLIAKMPDHELWMAFVRDPDGNVIGLMEERR